MNAIGFVTVAVASDAVVVAADELQAVAPNSSEQNTRNRLKM